MWNCCFQMHQGLEYKSVIPSAQSIECNYYLKCFITLFMSKIIICKKKFKLMSNNSLISGALRKMAVTCRRSRRLVGVL